MKLKTKNILKRCKVTEIIIDKKSHYIVGVEVSFLDNDYTKQVEFIQQVTKIFKQELDLDNCVFVPLVDGVGPFKIKEITEEEAKQLKGRNE